MSTLTAELTSEAKAPYTTSKIVRVSIKYPRIEGEVEVSPMATLDYVRVWGELTINGSTAHINATPSTIDTKLSRYELTRNGWINEPATTKAIEKMGELLPDIVKIALATTGFANEQRAIAIRHLGFDLESNDTDIKTKLAELEELRAKRDYMKELLAEYILLNANN